MRINKKAMAGAITGAAAAALVVVAIAGSNVANAVDNTPSPSATQEAPTGPPQGRPQEEALTGDTADRVKAAVEAKYPGATIDRMEKDSRGDAVYEAHITKADGTRARIALDANFAITGEQTGRPGGGMGHGPQEEALTGDTADKVKAAVEAKYPGATIERMEKDSHGDAVYEAHITKSDGMHARIALDADFAVTGEKTGGPGGPGMGGGMRGGPQEEALTGDTADKVKTAVEAKYPGATVERSSKESDGTAAYEAHLTKADGTHVKVLLDANFAVTGEETGHMGGPGRHGGPGDRDGGPGGRGDHDGGPMMGGDANGSAPTPSKTA